MIDPISAFSSKLSSSSVGAGAGVVPGANTMAGADFGTTLSQVASNAMQTMKTAETTSMAGLEGKASAQKVVEAVLAAEHSLQTAIAIRDKVVNAYLELTRMAI